MRARRPYALICGGGTGGHVFEALAVAQALEARGHDASSIAIVGSRRGQETRLLLGVPFGVRLLGGRGIVRRLDRRSTVANLKAIVALVGASASELGRALLHRPRVVVSVGGYASFPTSAAAVLLGVPLVLVTIDAVPGAVNRLFSRRAKVNAVVSGEVDLPRRVVTGVALRPEIASIRRDDDAMGRSRRILDLPPGRFVVGVVGGSLGARRLNQATEGLVDRWKERGDVAIFHVTGRREWAELRGRLDRLDACNEMDVDHRLWYRVVPFEDHMATLYEAVDVMVARAGAGTVAELEMAGVPSVLVPLPGAPRDHQNVNARRLVDAGAARLVRDDECDGAHLAQVLDDLLGDPGARGEMARAAAALGRPDAADRVAALAEQHAR